MKPIIQCITNNVTMNDCANAVLLSSSSPIMAHHICEAEEVQASASALLLNLGATDDYEAMKIALIGAKENGHPVVVDPVGISGIKFRREFLKELLAIGGITCIRGNYREIKAIITDRTTGYGLDYNSQASDSAGDESIDADELAVLMKKYAENTGIILVASGADDIICSGDKICRIGVGDEMMSSVTGSGCMLSAILASRLAHEADFEEITSTVEKYGMAGMRAADRTRNEKGGTGTFHMYFLDELSLTQW